MISATSVKDKLRNQAKVSRKLFQEVLTMYGLERTIYRISISEYNDYFTLKGGVFLYAIFDGNFSRVTRDVDFLARNMQNNAEDMKKVFENIFSIKYDDALYYDLNSLEVKNITEFKDYHGVKVSINAYLDKTIIPISIDIGFGDVVYPERTIMDFPVLLDMEIPKIYAYSISSIISEKFEAIVSLGDANSRYKDFYDIYILVSQFDLDGEELKEAIKETFEQRETRLDNIFAFTDDFLASSIHQNRWKAFLKKKKVLVSIELTDVVNLLQTLMSPVINSLTHNMSFISKWDHISKKWK